jgi:hypothetical protein
MSTKTKSTTTQKDPKRSKAPAKSASGELTEEDLQGVAGGLSVKIAPEVTRGKKGSGKVAIDF